jgi:hypothetical protein
MRRAVCALCRSSQPLFIIFLHFSPAELRYALHRETSVRAAPRTSPMSIRLIRPLRALSSPKVYEAQCQKIHFERSMQKLIDI